MLGLVVSAHLGEALAQMAPGVGGVPMVLALQSPKRLDRLAQQLFSIVPLPFVAKPRTQVTQRGGYRWMLVAVHFAIDGHALTVHRLGVVKAAIWANDTKVRVRYGVTFQRLSKDGEEWKTTDSFAGDDLPLVAKVADMAHTWIYQEARTGNCGERTDSDSGDGS